MKELKNGLSRYLRLVSRGEQVRITMRGRPVADLVPAGQARYSEKMRRLIAEGKVTPATKPLPRKAPPRERPRGGKPASDYILEERAAER